MKRLRFLTKLYLGYDDNGTLPYWGIVPTEPDLGSLALHYGARNPPILQFLRSPSHTYNSIRILTHTIGPITNWKLYKRFKRK